MPRLAFHIEADYQKVIRLREEIDKLKSTISGMDGDTSPATFRAMEVQLAKNTKELDSLVTSAVRAGNEINQNFKKQIFDASQAVNEFSEKIIAQKAVVKDIESDIKRLGDAYRVALKRNPMAASSKLEEYNAARKALDEEKVALFGLTQQQAEARLSVKKLRDEYALYKGDAKEMVDSNNGIVISWKKALAVIGGVAALKQFGSEMLRVRGEFQAADTAIQTLLGNKEKADALMKQVREYAKISPLEFLDVTKATQMMLGFNIEAEKVPKFISAIGDVSMGESGKFNSLTLAFSQMSAAGKLMGQDLNQMINAGFNPLQIMADKTGKSISTLKDEMSKGAISAEMVQQAFIDATSAGGKFYNMSENASKNINGQLSMMQDAMDSVFNELGQKSEEVIMSSIQMTTSLIENYETIGKMLIGMITTYGVYKTVLIANIALTHSWAVAARTDAAAKGIQTIAIKAQTVAQLALNTAMKANPYVLVATLITGTVAAMWAFHDSTTAAEKAQKQLNKEQEEAAHRKQELASKTDSLISKINSETESVYSQVKAYKELIKLFPELGNMSFEEFKNLSQNQQKKILFNINDNREINDAVKAYEGDLKRIEYIKKSISSTVALPNSGLAVSKLNKQLETANNLAKLHKEEIDRIKEAQWEANTPVEEKVKHYEDVKKRLVEEKDELEKTLTKSEDIVSVWMGVPDIINGIKLNTLNTRIDETTGKINSLMGKDVSVVKNKSYWEKKKKEAEAARDALAVSEKNSEDWNKYTREIQQAQKEISKYDTTGKAENEINKRLKLQQELNRSVLDSELKLQVSRISAMEDGKAKRLALAQQETKDTIASIQKEKKEYQRKIKETKGKEDSTVLTTFDNRELAAKAKEKADIAHIEKEYAEEYKQRTKTLTDVFLNEEERKLSAIKTRYAEERKWADQQLKTGGMTKEEHTSYTVNIDKAQQQETYRSLLNNLNDHKQKEKDLRNKWDTDINAAVESKDAYLVAKLMEGKQKALSSLNSQMLQESDEWQQLFGNLDNLTVEQLEKLSATIKKKAKNLDLKPIDMKAVTDNLKEVDELIRSKNPFSLLSKHLKEYKTVEDETTKKNTLKEMFRDAAASIDAVKDSFDAVIGGLEDIGLAGDEATQQLLGDISNLMGVSSQLATSIASTNPVGIIQGSIGVLTSVFNIFNNDKRHEKKIERIQEQIDVLNKSYEKLGNEIEKAYSKDASKMIDQQNKLLEQQKVLIQQQIREEQDKKKTDKDRIKEWQNQIDEINNTIADNKEAGKDAILGEDIKSAIDNFAQAYADAWAAGEDKAESAKDLVRKMIKNMIQESIKAAASDPMKEIREKLLEFWSDDYISDWEQDYLDRKAQDLVDKLDKQFGWADKYFKEDKEEEDVSDNSLKGAYAKASQESIDLLAGQTGAVRVLLEDIRGSMQPIREQMKLIYDMQSRGWEDVKAIRELSDKVEKNTDRIAENTREIKDVAGKISENTRGTVDALEGTINVKVKM